MASSRRKGKRSENELAELLRAAMRDRSIKRNLAQADDGGVDLVGRSLRHVAIEAKAHATPRWSEWLKQAQAQADESQYPVVATRQPGGTWRFLVQMDLLPFCQWVKFLNALRDGRP